MFQRQLSIVAWFELQNVLSLSFGVVKPCPQPAGRSLVVLEQHLANM